MQKYCGVKGMERFVWEKQEFVGDTELNWKPVQVFECGSDQSSLRAEFCTYWSSSVAEVQTGGDKCMDEGLGNKQITVRLQNL